MAKHITLVAQDQAGRVYSLYLSTDLEWLPLKTSYPKDPFFSNDLVSIAYTDEMGSWHRGVGDQLGALMTTPLLEKLPELDVAKLREALSDIYDVCHTSEDLETIKEIAGRFRYLGTPFGYWPK